jgi:hypothetical protein
VVPAVSVAVGPPSWQDAKDSNDAAAFGQLESDPKVADAQSPLLRILELSDVTS